MYKLIDSASFFHEDEPIVTILDLNKVKGGLEKVAADTRVMDFVSNLTPEDGNIYVHILAMGAGEYFGANRNADFFPEENLIQYHKTFETTPAHIFRNHVNKDPAIAIGRVIYSIYNERMHRVEVIASIDRVKGRDIVERVEQGDFPATSMACKTPYDICSICGNKAHTRQEYCIHLRTQLGKMYGDGRKVMAINSGPLKFFDMSVVFRPADVTSSVLQKVAHEADAISSAELAESEGISDQLNKFANISKLADFIKEVDDGYIVDSDQELEKLLSKVKDPNFNLIPILKNFKLNDVLMSMAHMGISPSLAFLAELIAVKLIGDHMKGSGPAIASLMGKVDTSNITVPKDLNSEVTGPQESIMKLFVPNLADSSLLPDYVEKRAFIFPPDREDFRGVHYNTNIGYVGNGPIIEQTPYEKWQAANPSFVQQQGGIGKLLNTLLAVGGAALAAKWYISKAIEEKAKQSALNSNIIGGNGVKIVLVKSASDYKLTNKLAKASLVKCIRDRK